ncbi:thiocillin family RiPP [Streptomyces sp. ZAF1911]|uniref:thiocillin family RiPP n=1 Tax=unclassified Streptomyces TaxID=2593676 RepID=UPI00237AF9CF|nr:thiocillin family RiPP [Streptomyces sp. ZAF1911]MDD9375798.1 thiocillin family RiPP [Streptomyces sp. ZAF1911]
MNDLHLDLRLDQELPELEALPAAESAAGSTASSASCIGSASCPVMTYGTAASVSSS